MQVIRRKPLTLEAKEAKKAREIKADEYLKAVQPIKKELPLQTMLRQVGSSLF